MIIIISSLRFYTALKKFYNIFQEGRKEVWRHCLWDFFFKVDVNIDKMSIFWLTLKFYIFIEMLQYMYIVLYSVHCIIFSQAKQIISSKINHFLVVKTFNLSPGLKKYSTLSLYIKILKSTMEYHKLFLLSHFNSVATGQTFLTPLYHYSPQPLVTIECTNSCSKKKIVKKI